MTTPGPDLKTALFEFLAERARTGRPPSRKEVERAVRRAGFREHSATVSALLREWEALGALGVEEEEVVSIIRRYRLRA